MPELVEPVESINKWLKRDYGQETDGSARWRVVWSEDLIEKRIMTHTDSGMQLLVPEVREVRKYQHIKDRYVLEFLEPVRGETDLLTRLSYEPRWTFEDRFGKYLPPRFDACAIIIASIEQNMEHRVFHKYKNPEDDPEYRAMRLQEMEEYLFGNETPVGDALAHKFGVTDFHEKVDFTDKKETIN